MRDRRACLFALVLIAHATCAGLASAQGEPGWVDLLADPTLGAWRAPRGQWQLVGEVAPRADDPSRLTGTGSGSILYNGPAGRTPNLLSNEEYGDLALHTEFLVPRGSNSGIKFEGVYEIQIADSHGKAEATASDCGGVYPNALLLPSYHHINEGFPPKLNAARPPGEWQTLDVVFRAPRFDAKGRKLANARLDTVSLNGVVIHEALDLPFATGHAWMRPEAPTGRILLQGDHGPVAFRNLMIRPLPSGDAGRPEPSALNREFANPDLDVASWVRRFESEDREVLAHRDQFAALLDLRPGAMVADIGAGSGAFTRPFAARVGRLGVVYAVDIAPPFLWHIEEQARADAMPQIRTVLGRPDSILLPRASIDAAFLCDTYHHFEDPVAMLASIRAALKPGGRLVLVEFDRREGISSEFVLKHVRADRATFLAEIQAAGFEPIELPDAPALKENFVAAFRRTADVPAGAGR